MTQNDEMNPAEALQVTMQEYRETWERHIRELDLLRWNLTTRDKGQLDTIQSLLRELLDRAAHDLERRRAARENQP